MSPETSCDVLHLFYDILTGSEIDEVLRPGLQDEVFLAPGVNANDSQADSAGGYLGSQMTEASRKTVSYANLRSPFRSGKLTATCAEEDDPVTTFGVRLAKSTVDRDTSTEPALSCQLGGPLLNAQAWKAHMGAAASDGSESGIGVT